MTRNIATEDVALESATLASASSPTRPIIVERAQYWPIRRTWAEAHNSFGVTETATRWGLAEGRVGGPGSAQTYILLANPGTQRAEVDVTFFRSDGIDRVEALHGGTGQPHQRRRRGSGQPRAGARGRVVRRAHRIDAADRGRALALQQRRRRRLGIGTNATATRLP